MCCSPSGQLTGELLLLDRGYSLQNCNLINVFGKYFDYTNHRAYSAVSNLSKSKDDMRGDVKIQLLVIIGFEKIRYKLFNLEFHSG